MNRSPCHLFVVLLFFIVLASAGFSLGRQTKDVKAPSASISGRVTLNGKPAPNVSVILTRGAIESDGEPVAKVTTDEDGRFRSANLPAGAFFLIPVAPAYVFDDRTMSGQPGKLVTVADGEAVEGVYVSLRRGGAMSGKITDSTGRPVVEQTVTLTAIDEQRRQSTFDHTSWRGGQTDDRGIYRIYGVPDGRYIASVGESPKQPGPGPIHYPLTFHPGVTDDSKANIIELGPGAEAAGIDITIGLVEKSFVVSGRTVDAETGKPVANISYGYGLLYEGRGISLLDWGKGSDAQGYFRIQGLKPGHYGAFIVNDGDGEYYSDVSAFDLNDADVSGLEIKVQRGSRIRGVAVIEGLPDSDVAEKLAGLRIRASISTDLGAPLSMPSKIAPDGGFLINGLRPGKVRLELGGYPLPKGFTVTRVERDGAEQRDGLFDISAGEQVSGVRVTVAYGTALIRGQLKIIGETPPPGLKLAVRLHRTGTNTNRPDWSTETDDRFRFLFEGLAQGDYEVILTGPNGLAARKQVTVSNNGETEIIVVIDLRAKDK